jgi:glycosyltransferase involved in cell wall biosynthesis
LAILDVYAIPSDTEQFPISLVEAMAARLPVVATRVGDVAEILSKDNQSFTADPSDEVSLADHLRALLQDKALRMRLGHSNRQRVAQAYPLSIMVDKYHQLYSQAL